MDSNFCPFCICDPCSCNWENHDDNIEEGEADLIQVDDQQCDGDGGPCALPPITDFGSTIFDCISGFSGYPRESMGRKHNSNIISEIPILKIGDLVKWYPIHGMTRYKTVWVVKRILNPKLMDSGWYDYEITDGIENHMVTKYELFQVRNGDE
jgi:hypothetical protein